MKKQKKLLSLVLCLSMALASFGLCKTTSVEAAKKASLKKKSITLDVGETKKIAIKNKNKKNKYTFSSNKKSVATVSKKGVVTGESAGKAVITVKEKTNSKSRKLGKIKVTVFDDNVDSSNNTQQTNNETVNSAYTENNSTQNSMPSNQSSSTNTSSSSSNQSTTPQVKTYGLNDPWIVDGQWKLTITGVEKHYACNSYSDQTGAEVVIISYTYENLGYFGDRQNLYFDLGYVTSNIYDSEGYAADRYPCTHCTKPAVLDIVGSKCSASAAFILTKSGHKLSIHFGKTTSNGNGKQQADFFIPY